MPRLRDLLFIYDELEPRDRARADELLAREPAAIELVRQGRVLRDVLQSGRVGEISDEILATVITLKITSSGPPEGPLADMVGRVEAVLEDDPELAARYAQLEQRLASIVEHVGPPRERLDALLAQAPAARPGGARTDERRRADRDPLRTRRRKTVWRAAASLAAAIVLIAFVVVISQSQRPEVERLAALHELPATYETPRLRGEAAELPPAHGQYARALETIREGRSTTLGLFPRYDDAQIASARNLLDGVVAQEEPDSPLGLEARYVLARLSLYQGEVQAAREHLRAVVDGQGPSAPDAAALLARLGDL